MDTCPFFILFFPTPKSLLDFYPAQSPASPNLHGQTVEPVHMFQEESIFVHTRSIT
jgi:hypothetical protein